MKIDYELVEKIGVKYFIDIDSDEFIPVKFENGKIYIYQKGGFILTSWNDSDMEVVKPIPPKPPVTVEYEKVTDSIFDLKDEFERGELYCMASFKEYKAINNLDYLCEMYHSSGIYRRIEKEVDWRDEVIATAPAGYGISKSGEFNGQLVIDGIYSKEQAITLAESIITATA